MLKLKLLTSLAPDRFPDPGEESWQRPAMIGILQDFGEIKFGGNGYSIDHLIELATSIQFTDKVFESILRMSDVFNITGMLIERCATDAVYPLMVCKEVRLNHVYEEMNRKAVFEITHSAQLLINCLSIKCILPLDKMYTVTRLKSDGWIQGRQSIWRDGFPNALATA